LNLYFLGYNSWSFLSLTFSRQVYIEKIDLDYLGFALSKLQKLVKIDIQFFKYDLLTTYLKAHRCNKEFDNSCVKTIFNGISQITNLKNLIIHFEEYLHFENSISH